ncbi:hypothetical protein D3C83_104840 [compost metagenome]
MPQVVAPEMDVRVALVLDPLQLALLRMLENFLPRRVEQGTENCRGRVSSVE